jgi:hypothetical protein
VTARRQSSQRVSCIPHPFNPYCSPALSPFARRHPHPPSLPSAVCRRCIQVFWVVGFTNLNNSAGAAAMLHALHQTGGPVLVAWESWNIPSLIRTMGCNRSLLSSWEGASWWKLHPDHPFDPVFILQFHHMECTSLTLEQLLRRKYNATMIAFAHVA